MRRGEFGIGFLGPVLAALIAILAAMLYPWFARLVHR